MSDRVSLFVLTSCAALTRVVAAIVLGDRFHFVDETIYLDAARHLLAGEGYGAGYANVPGQPLLLAALAAPFPASLLAVRVLHALVVGVAGSLVLHALGSRTVGASATRVALAFYALDPLLVVAGGLLYPDAGAAVVLAAALLAGVVAARSDRLGASAASGALVGVAVLLRPVAAAVGPVLAVWIVTAGHRTITRRASHAAVVALACTMLVAPWLLANVRSEGAAVPASMRGMQHAPVAQEDLERNGLATSLARAAWRNPLPLARHVVRELAHFWELSPTRLSTDVPERRAAMHAADPRLPAETAFPPTVRDTVSTVASGVELGLGLVGIAVGWRRQRRIVALLAGTALVYGLGYALFIAKLRYRIGIVPEVLLLAGLGLVAIVPALGACTDADQSGARRPSA